MSKTQNPIEHWMEEALFASRRILSPFYLGLALSLLVLLVKFMAELGHLALHAFTSTESEVILGVLALVDLALSGSLLIIVIFSGYENFVSRMNHEGHKDWPEWMGTIDFSALKLKLLSSIVAISAIQLFKKFMAIERANEKELFWLVVIHIVFVVSSVLLALSDRISGHQSHAPGANGSGHGGGDPHGSETPAKSGGGPKPAAPVSGETMITNGSPSREIAGETRMI